MTDVLAIVLGGGRGTRLFPLTHHRSKPAVPIGGKYRLIDIPLSNCLHAGLTRIFVLTQYNSASLNRHIAQTYRLDLFADGFVEVLATEQTPDGERWFQGTADAVRQAARHFRDLDADCFLILAGDDVHRVDFAQLVEAHLDRNSDITIVACPVTPDEATRANMLRMDRDGRVTGVEGRSAPDPSRELAAPSPLALPGRLALGDPARAASMGIYVFSRDALFDLLARDEAVDLAREVIPHAVTSHRVHAFLYRGFWADVGSIRSFYDVNLMLTRRDAPFDVARPRPIYTRPRFLPAARLDDCHIDESIVADGTDLDSCEVAHSVVGIRTVVRRGARITRSVLLGADFWETSGATVPLGIGRDVVLDGVIVDKNARIGDGARLVNEHRHADADGEGYCIRDGIIIVPKGGVVKPGTVV